MPSAADIILMKEDAPAGSQDLIVNNASHSFKKQKNWVGTSVSSLRNIRQQKQLSNSERAPSTSGSLISSPLVGNGESFESLSVEKKQEIMRLFTDELQDSEILSQKSFIQKTSEQQSVASSPKTLQVEVEKTESTTFVDPSSTRSRTARYYPIAVEEENGHTDKISQRSKISSEQVVRNRNLIRLLVSHSLN